MRRSVLVLVLVLVGFLAGCQDAPPAATVAPTAGSRNTTVSDKLGDPRPHVEPITSKPKPGEREFNAGVKALAASEFETASSQFDKAIQLGHGSEARFGRGQATYEQARRVGDLWSPKAKALLGEAAVDFRAVLQSEPKDQAANFNLALCLFHTGDYAVAEKLFVSVKTKFPEAELKVQDAKLALVELDGATSEVEYFSDKLAKAKRNLKQGAFALIEVELIELQLELARYRLARWRMDGAAAKKASEAAVALHKTIFQRVENFGGTPNERRHFERELFFAEIRLAKIEGDGEKYINRHEAWVTLETEWRDKFKELREKGSVSERELAVREEALNSATLALKLARQAKLQPAGVDPKAPLPVAVRLDEREKKSSS